TRSEFSAPEHSYEARPHPSPVPEGEGPFSGVGVGGAMRQEIQPAQFPTPETYATGYRIGDTVWLAGQTPVGDDGKIVGVGDPRAQAHRIFERIGLCLKEAGATPQDVIFFRTYLTDMRNAPVVREER